MATRDLEMLLRDTLTGLGYDLVDVQRVPGRGGGLIRVLLDRPGGITVDDCADVSRHLTRLFAAEGVAYDRLEVSSPGLDRPLKHAQDFRRFLGERAQVRTRLAIQGRRNFTGVLREATDSTIALEVDGALISLELTQVDKARLVPNL